MRPLPTLLLASMLPLLVPAPAVAAPSAPTVMVLYFDNDTGDPHFDVLGKGLADMMITDLATAPGVQVVEREKLEALVRELKLERSKFFDAKTAQRLGKGCSAEYAVTGSVSALSPSMRLDVRVIRVTTGQVVKASRVTGEQAKFFDLQQALVAQLVDGLGKALSPADVGKVNAAAAANRVDDVSAARDYGQALDLRDRGDMQSASQHMQQVMQRAPTFALARARYLEIMKQLYAAKDTRGKALSQSEKKLLADIDQRMANPKNKHASDEDRYFSYRILRGQYELRKLADSLSRPSQEYLPHVRAYLENQKKLIDELVAWHKKHGLDDPPEQGGPWGLEEEDRALARDLQLGRAGSYFGFSLGRVQQDLAAFLAFGAAPGDEDQVQLKKQLCFSRLDPAFARESFRLYDAAIDTITRRAAIEHPVPVQGRDNQIVELLIEEAQLDMTLGKPEDAVARLQSVLNKYPKARLFDEAEQMLRAILASNPAMPNGAPIVPCEDPK